MEEVVGVTLHIHGSDESMQVPLPVGATVSDIKAMFAARLDKRATLTVHTKPTKTKASKKLSKNDAVGGVYDQVVLKGLTTFQRPKQKYAHPYLIIGAGHFGLRQAMTFKRDGGIDWQQFDKYERLGGHAWVSLANETSKLQCDGAQYQLQYDPIDGNVDGLLKDYGIWPSRQTILDHFEDIVKKYGLHEHMTLGTEITEMKIIPNKDLAQKRYDMKWNKVSAPGETGKFSCCCIAFYPGAICIPRPLNFEGEETFGGPIAFGHGNLFPYKDVTGKHVMLIGMGSFANENIRTMLENGVKLIDMVVRRLNVFLPRCVCWYINQSNNPPPGPYIFNMMGPMYELTDWDVWDNPHIHANSKRTTATLKQKSRWGTGDTFFLACYYEIVVLTVGRVARLSHRTAHLEGAGGQRGKIIEDLDFIDKCTGFTGDFKVDELMQAETFVGFWPEGDWRRWVFAEFLSIDAGRFGGTCFGPGGVSTTKLAFWYFQHPGDAEQILKNGFLSKHSQDVEGGKPAYDFEPRAASSNMMMLGGVPELQEFEGLHNGPFKKASLWHLQPPHVQVRECKADWDRYCKMVQDQGNDKGKPHPAYPYTAEILIEYERMERELSGQPANKASAAAGDNEGEGAKEEAEEAEEEDAPNRF